MPIKEWQLKNAKIRQGTGIEHRYFSYETPPLPMATACIFQHPSYPYVNVLSADFAMYVKFSRLLAHWVQVRCKNETYVSTAWRVEILIFALVLVVYTYAWYSSLINLRNTLSTCHCPAVKLLWRSRLCWMRADRTLVDQTVIMTSISEEAAGCR